MCASNPCENDAVCTDLGNDIRCDCLTDFSGYYCETCKCYSYVLNDRCQQNCTNTGDWSVGLTLKWGVFYGAYHGLSHILLLSRVKYFWPVLYVMSTSGIHFFWRDAKKKQKQTKNKTKQNKTKKQEKKNRNTKQNKKQTNKTRKTNKTNKINKQTNKQTNRLCRFFAD